MASLAKTITDLAVSMIVEIAGAEIRTERDLHRVLAGPLDFGPYYGRNLAALRDRLQTDVVRPVRLVWHDADASRAHLGDELFRRILEILDETQQQDATFGWADRFVYELR